MFKKLLIASLISFGLWAGASAAFADAGDAAIAGPAAEWQACNAKFAPMLAQQVNLIPTGTTGFVFKVDFSPAIQGNLGQIGCSITYHNQLIAYYSTESDKGAIVAALEATRAKLLAAQAATYGLPANAYCIQYGGNSHRECMFLGSPRDLVLRAEGWVN